MMKCLANVTRNRMYPTWNIDTHAHDISRTVSLNCSTQTCICSMAWFPVIKSTSSMSTNHCLLKHFLETYQQIWVKEFVQSWLDFIQFEHGEVNAVFQQGCEHYAITQGTPRPFQVLTFLPFESCPIPFTRNPTPAIEQIWYVVTSPPFQKYHLCVKDIFAYFLIFKDFFFSCPLGNNNH